MGKIKYLKDIERFINQTNVFSVKDIRIFLISKKANPNYAYLLLHNLVKQGKIKRIIKGYYSTLNDPSLLTYCIKPSYIGLENALSLHGLWEQETNLVLITPRKIRGGIRTVFDTNIVIHIINSKYFFGYDYVDYYNLKIPVSDIEKTFIDLIFYKKYIDETLLKVFKKKMDIKKLRRYLKHYNKKIINKVKNLLKE